MNFEFWLGPWIWVPDGWGSHPLVKHWLDLGSTAVCGIAGKTIGSTRPMMFCATLPGVMLPVGWLHLGSGDPRDIKPTTKARTSWGSMLGYTPAGDTALDWVMDYRMTGADPRGLSATAPAMPGSRLQLWFANQLIVDRPFDWATDPYAAKCLEVKKLLYDAEFDFEKSTAVYKPEDGHVQRMLSKECEDTKLPYTAFLSDRLKGEIDGVLPHKTSYGPEDWTGVANNTIINNTLTYTEVLNDAQILADAVRCVTTGSARVSVRAEHDLSSVNHYCQARVLVADLAQNPIVGVCFRFASAAETYYSAHYQSTAASSGAGRFNIAKVSTGTPSSIATFDSTVSTPFTIYGSVGNGGGDALVCLADGVSKISTTDSSITTGTRFGFRLRCITTGDSIINLLYADDSFATANRARLIGGISINRPAILSGGALVC